MAELTPSHVPHSHPQMKAAGRPLRSAGASRSWSTCVFSARFLSLSLFPPRFCPARFALCGVLGSGLHHLPALTQTRPPPEDTASPTNLSGDGYVRRGAFLRAWRRGGVLLALCRPTTVRPYSVDRTSKTKQMTLAASLKHTPPDYSKCYPS